MSGCKGDIKLARAMQEYDVAHGATQYTWSEVLQRLDALGYALDRRFDCKSVGRASSGHTFPCLSVGIVEKDTGKRFSHVDARRDANFEELQRFRMWATCIHKGYVVSL